MKLKNVLLAVVTVLTIASAGQTWAGEGTDLGTIIVYRPWTVTGWHIENLGFNLNHGPELLIRNGTYYRFTVLPGDTILSHDDALCLDDDLQTVHVEPGETVYFEYTIGLTVIFEVAENQERAARTVSRLQPLN
jgi:hypothetical protein